MSKMKICHLTSAHNSSDTRILHKECVSLAKNNNYQVYLIAEGKTNTIKNVEIIGIGDKPKSRIKRILFFSNRVFKAAKEIDADIYHLHDPELLPYALKLKKMGKLVIFDAHENYEELILEKEYINKYFRKLIQRIFNLYYENIIGKLDGLIGVTPNMEKNMRRISNNVCIITNYPILNRNKCNLTKKENNCILAFAGGINENWCHDKIINNIQDINKVTYKLMGFSNSEYYNNLKELDINKKVNFVGRIAHEDVHEELCKSTIGLAILNYSRNTFYNEGTMGNTKIFEEMSAGLPVICTDFLLWRDLVIDKYNCGIYINPNEFSQFKKAVLKLFNDPELRKKMGENARRAVEEEFNWSTQEKKLYEFYEKLIYFKNLN